jgi:glutamate/tyrosine decarboxylase-like PLP-dependent enzyme
MQIIHSAKTPISVLRKEIDEFVSQKLCSKRCSPQVSEVPEEDMEVLGRVYGQESTALGAT